VRIFEKLAGLMGLNEIVIFPLIKMFDYFLHLTQLGSGVFSDEHLYDSIHDV